MKHPLAARLLLLVMLVAVPACQPGPDPRVVTSPAASPRVMPSVNPQDPSGSWLLFTQQQPSPGPFVACLPNFEIAKTASGFQARTVCAGFCAKPYGNWLDGGFVDGKLSFSGTGDDQLPVQMAFVFDLAAQHFVGTQNGQSVWLAPFQKLQDGTCEQRVY